MAALYGDDGIAVAPDDEGWLVDDMCVLFDPVCSPVSCGCED